MLTQALLKVIRCRCFELQFLDRQLFHNLDYVLELDSHTRYHNQTQQHFMKADKIRISMNKFLNTVLGSIPARFAANENYENIIWSKCTSYSYAAYEANHTNQIHISHLLLFRLRELGYNVSRYSYDPYKRI